MSSLFVKRIEEKLKEDYTGKIDISDIKPNDSSSFESRALAAYALVMKSNISIIDSGGSVTDGYNDLGIDSIYLDTSQNKLFLVQSKWRKDGSGGVDQDEITSFVNGIKRIINADLNGANKKILDKASDIDFALSKIDYQISAIFIHTGDQKINEFVKRPVEELCRSVNDADNTLFVFDEILLTDIYNHMAKGMGSDEITLENVVIQNWGKIESPYAAYYGIVSGDIVANWYRDHGKRLFEKNLRYYKGDTEVNERIKRGLLDEPENFFYYNNGIKLLCKKVTREIKKSASKEIGIFTLEGVSLVNGAQTTGSIWQASCEKPERVTEARVMVQVIDLSQAERGTTEHITKFSNTQNRIDNKDFAALDPNQERLRKDLAFSHITYLYKSGDVISDPDIQITFDEGIVALACLNEDVSYSTIAKGNVGALSADITKPPYKVLINSGTDSVMLLNAVTIMRMVDKKLTAIKGGLSGTKRLIAVHGNRFIAHCVLNKLKEQNGGLKEGLNKEVVQQKVYELVDNLIDPIAKVISDEYPGAYPASIFKNNTKCKNIYEKIQVL